MTISPARRAAYEVLLRVFEQDAFADRALATAAKELDQRDRALSQRLAYGAVQRVRTIDHAIETLGGRPVAKLDPPVRAALRLGTYQLGWLEGVARYAAVNESVELVRRARLERAVPFTNAVLRRVEEGLGQLLDALPDGPLKESYPDWIWDVWRRDLGEAEALALMRAQNEPLPDRRPPGRGSAAGGARPGRAGRVPRPASRRGRPRRGQDLAAERCVAARRARGRLTGGRARARPVRGAGREDDDVARRRRRGRDAPRPGQRAAGERRPPPGRPGDGGRGRRARAPGGARRLRPRARRRPVLGDRSARRPP